MKTTIDEQFYAPRLPVSIVALPNSASEVYPLRDLLEALNYVTTVHWVGAPTDGIINQSGLFQPPLQRLTCLPAYPTSWRSSAEYGE